MSQLLTLSRAARLVGITRGALQKRIKDGDLATFEGMVTAHELLRVFPQTRLEDNTLLERLNLLKEGAFARRIRERLLPDPEVLAARLMELGTELAHARANLERHRAVVTGLADRLAQMEREPGGEILARRLRVWLEAELAAAKEDQEEQSLVAMDNVLRIMSAHVLLLPSQHEFFTEGSDTILEAALRSGLSVNYGCTSGNCGLCKARVVSGEVKKVRVHDYVLSEAEKSAGYVLLCSNAAVGDVVVEALEAKSVLDIQRQHISARVKSVVPLMPDLLLLALQTPRTQRLRFFAGQSAWLTTGDGHSAELPIASCPCDDRNLEFHVHLHPDDPFARRMESGLRVSEVVVVDGPSGEFVLNDTLPRPVLFVAIEHGFAPVKSLIEHALALDTAESLHLYWLTGAPQGRYLDNLCRSWADALDNFHYTPLTGPIEDADVLARVIADHPDLVRFDVFVAGPESAVAAAHDVLLRAGVPATQIQVSVLA